MHTGLRVKRVAEHPKKNVGNDSLRAYETVDRPRRTQTQRERRKERETRLRRGNHWKERERARQRERQARGKHTNKQQLFKPEPKAIPADCAVTPICICSLQ
ncbi:unnamed protein product [Scytosiphon promiscuus]